MANRRLFALQEIKAVEILGENKVIGPGIGIGKLLSGDLLEDVSANCFVGNVRIENHTTQGTEHPHFFVRGWSVPPHEFISFGFTPAVHALYDAIERFDSQVDQCLLSLVKVASHVTSTALNLEVGVEVVDRINLHSDGHSPSHVRMDGLNGLLWESQVPDMFNSVQEVVFAHPTGSLIHCK